MPMTGGELYAYTMTLFEVCFVCYLPLLCNIMFRCVPLFLFDVMFTLCSVVYSMRMLSLYSVMIYVCYVA